MYRLYARTGAGSAAIEAMLHATGQEFEIEEVKRLPDGSIPADFYRINPLGEVPTLILPDDTMMTESAAMMIYLADSYPSAGLAPSITSALRPRYLRWMMFLATNIYLGDLRFLYPLKYTTDQTGFFGIKQKASEVMSRDFELLSEALGDGPFMLGATMTALDIYLAMLVSWAPDVPALYAKHPNIRRLAERVAQQPAVAKAWARNGM